MPFGIFANNTGTDSSGRDFDDPDSFNQGLTPGRGGSVKKNRFRDALEAATKYKERTDYKAKREADEKENAAASRATMKIAPDISVMEGYTDPGFVIAGQEGTRSRNLGLAGRFVGGFIGGPLGGQVGGTIGSMLG